MTIHRDLTNIIFYIQNYIQTYKNTIQVGFLKGNF